MTQAHEGENVHLDAEGVTCGFWKRLMSDARPFAITWLKIMAVSLRPVTMVSESSLRSGGLIMT